MHQLKLVYKPRPIFYGTSSNSISVTLFPFSISLILFQMSITQKIFYVVAILLLFSSGQTLCHTKGLRPRNSSTRQQNKNMTQTQISELQFMKWVRFVGRLKHSVFRTAKNKLFPSITLTVSKNQASGDFTSIQDAIDSLPFINLVRVVIKVHAGVYT